ncbi:MAG: hypothetical protein JJT75_05540 [Opitutales bacterium]|nr:hypothetical protein [Opitutales bacterium]
MNNNAISRMVGKRLSLAILISVIVHFVLLILLGLWTVYRYVQEGDPGMEVAMEQGEEMEAPQEVMEEVEVTEVQPEVEIDLDRLTVDPLRDVSLPEIVADTQAVPTPPAPTVPTTTADQVSFRQAAPRGSWGNVFGSSDESDYLLSGKFYDFKQTPDGDPSGISNFPREVREFVESGFDRSTIDNKFFSAPELRTVSYIAHPRMYADLAPAAYGLEGIVEAERWIIHYEGVISPPETGRYRFTAYADDQALVAIDGQVIVDGSRQKISDSQYHGSRVHGNMPETNDSNFSRTSDWIEMNANRNYEIDIIVGENPGGRYMAWILVEKEGFDYEQVGGYPRLHLFSTIEMEGAPDFDEAMEELGVSRARVPPLQDEVLAFPRK